jgi:mRNA interferase RelE/StbE
MSYNLQITRTAQKELATIHKSFAITIRDKILELAENPRPEGSQKLRNREGWRIRSGDYRIIYEIDDKNKNILILHIGHLREIYRHRD